ncbi:rod shape-determining protein MreC [Candidatus Spongiihabitans sp.]|uniref:rod shape-determining protein MreC n=1 Tax=Candidatus Spongiihabitans sp. TaxID=3101308 RepID=UPI003C6FB4AC
MNYNSRFPLFRFFLLLVLSMGVMIIDHRSELLKPIHTASTVVNIFFESVIAIPKNTFSLLNRYYPDDRMHQRFVELQQKQSILEARLQRYDALEKENQRLSKLLSASKRFANEMLFTEVIGRDLEPFSHRIVINSGIEAGVYLGQPAITPQGVLGQVSKVGYRRSVVTLITDPSHGLSVQIQRNGLRTIIQGSGKSNQVTVPFLENPADIQTGDLLVTSGLGGRFPAGYKVAEVSDIVKDANQAFLIITARTMAQTGFAKEALLLRNNASGNNDRSNNDRSNNNLLTNPKLLHSGASGESGG